MLISKKLYQILFLLLICSLLRPAWGQMDEYAPGETQKTASQAENYKFYGEYGLWVELKGVEVTVHWITTNPDSGFLNVFRDGAPIHSFKTPDSLVHNASFPLPEKQDIKIQYGALGHPSDRHETVLYLSETFNNRPVQFNKVDSVFVIGDVHGEYDTLIRLLANARLLNADLTWRAKRAHLVFMGDLFDRGDDVIKTLWFIYNLEKQAEARGGKVHVMLGNHEIMAFLNDLRYTSGKELSVARYYNIGYTKMFDIHESLLGRWLASKPAMLKINSILFAHGGVTPPFTVFSLKSFNDSLYAYLHETEFPSLLKDGVSTVRGDATLYARRLYFFFGDNSVFWDRGYILSDTLKSDLNKVLDKFDAKYHVVAHTPVTHIRTFYGGKVFAVDLHNPATEMLLMIYTPYRYINYRYPLEGKAEPL